ncbi:MAG: hypothetical protein PHV07_05655 [Oscillospiraceae bacterium]|nr:hypothetical protein [Oscillospiraceae bacterium]
MTEKERKEMEKLQYEAAERVREMSRRAQNPISSAASLPPMPSFVQTPYNKSNMNNREDRRQSQSSQNPKHKNSSGFSPKFEENHAPKPLPLSKQNKGFDILNMLNLKNLKMDNDIMLIIMMVLILSSETSDELLLLALVYIML